MQCERQFAPCPPRRAAGVVRGRPGHRAPGRAGRGNAPAAPSGLRGPAPSATVGRRRSALDSARHLLAGLLRERVLDPSPDRRAHLGRRSRQPALGALRLLRVRAGSQGGVRAARVPRLRLQPERGDLPLLGRRVLQGRRPAPARLDLGRRLAGRVAHPAHPAPRRPEPHPRSGGPPAPGSRLLRYGSDRPRIGQEPLRRRLSRRHDDLRRPSVAIEPGPDCDRRPDGALLRRPFRERSDPDAAGSGRRLPAAAGLHQRLHGGDQPGPSRARFAPQVSGVWLRSSSRRSRLAGQRPRSPRPPAGSAPTPRRPGISTSTGIAGSSA